MTGVIKKLLRDKKCGFIRTENGAEYFFHASALKNAQYDELVEGQEVVDFEDAEGPKGPRAEDVYV
jgi:cold shock CspA family protein